MLTTTSILIIGGILLFILILFFIIGINISNIELDNIFLKAEIEILKRRSNLDE